MKRLLHFVLVASLAIPLSSCGKKDSSAEEVEVLKQEIEVLKQELESQKSNNQNQENLLSTASSDDAVSNLDTVDSDSSSHQLIEFKTPVTVPDYGEFTIKGAKLKQKVEPSNPDAFYTYYEVKDPNTIYLDVVMDFKNTSTIGIGADNLTDVKVIYDNTYTYDSFAVVEKRDGSEFDQAFMEKIDPLKEATLHFLSELPLETKESDKSIKIQFEIYDNKYEMIVR